MASAFKGQILDIPLAGGLNTKLYEKLVGVGKATVLENVELGEAGVLARRPDYALYSSGAPENALAVSEEVLAGLPQHQYVVYTDTYTWYTTETINLWLYRADPAPGPCTMSVDGVIVADVVQAKLLPSGPSGQPTVVYLKANGALCSRTKATGFAVETTLEAAGTCSVGFDAIHYFASGVANLLFYMTHQVSPDRILLKCVGPTTVSTTYEYGLEQAPAMSLDVTTVGTTVTAVLYLAFPDTDRVLGLNTYIVQTAGVLGTFSTATVGFDYTTVTDYVPLTPTPIAVTVGAGYNRDPVWLIPSVSTVGSTLVWRLDIVRNVQEVGPFSNMIPVTRPTVVGSYYYWWALADRGVTTSTEPSVQASYVLCRCSATRTAEQWSTALTAGRGFNIVGTACRDNAIDAAVRHAMGATFLPSGMDGFRALLITSPVNFKTVVNGTTVWYSTATDVTISQTAPVRTAELQKHYVTTGGMPYEKDGSISYESGFNQYPEIIDVDYGTDGSVTEGTYYVCFTYKHLDTRGQIIESAPSIAATAVVDSGNDQIVCAVTNYAAGQRPWKLVTYVSTDNVTFYEVQSTALTYPTAAQASYQVVTISALTNLTSGPILYTSGGVLDNLPIGTISDVVTYNGRFWAVTPDGVMFYSKPVTAGIGIEWIGELGRVQLNSDAGSYWRLVSTESALYAFGENTIQVITGDGVDNLGTVSSSTLSAPSNLRTVTGILSGSPVCLDESGIWYKDAAGIHSIGNDGSVKGDVGLPVYAYDAETLVAINPVPGEGEVRFVLANGTILVYDTDLQVWSTHNTGLTGLVDGYTIDGVHYVVGTNVYVHSTTYNATRPMVFETPEIRLGQLQAIQRVTHVTLGFEAISSSSTAHVDIYYDGSTTPAETLQITPLYATHTAGDLVQWRWHIGRRCQSVKLRIEVGGSTKGAKIVSAALELTVKGGLSRLSADGVL